MREPQGMERHSLASALSNRQKIAALVSAKRLLYTLESQSSKPAGRESPADKADILITLAGCQIALGQPDVAKSNIAEAKNLVPAVQTESKVGFYEQIANIEITIFHDAEAAKETLAKAMEGLKDVRTPYESNQKIKEEHYSKIAHLYFQIGDLPTSVKAINVITDDHERSQLYVSFLDSKWDAGEFVAAEHMANFLSRASDKLYAYHVLIGHYYRSKQKNDKTAELLQKCRNIVDEGLGGPPEKQAYEYLYLAESYLDRNEPQVANKYLKAAENLLPNITDKVQKPGVMRLVSIVQAKSGDLNAALATAQAITDDPIDRSVAIRVIATIKAQSGDIQESRRLFDLASQNQGYHSARDTIAYVVSEQASCGDLEGALNTLEANTIRKPDAFRRLLLEAQKIKDRPSAQAVVKAIEEQIRSDTDNFTGISTNELPLLLAQAYTCLQIPDEAKKHLQIYMNRIDSLAKEFMSEIERVNNYKEIAKTYSEIGDNDQAKQILERVLVHINGVEFNKYAFTITKEILDLNERIGNHTGSLKLIAELEENLKSQETTLKTGSLDYFYEAYRQTAMYRFELGDLEGAKTDLHHITSRVEAEELLKHGSGNFASMYRKYFDLAKDWAKCGDTVKSLSLLKQMGEFIGSIKYEDERLRLLKKLAETQSQIVSASTEIADIDYDQLKDIIMEDGKPDKNLMDDLEIVASREELNKVLQFVPDTMVDMARQQAYQAAGKYKSPLATESGPEILQWTSSSLESLYAAPQTDSMQLIKGLFQVINNLDAKEGRDFILELARKQKDGVNLAERSVSSVYFMRLLHALLEINTFRGNDLAYAIACSESAPHHYSSFIFGRLIKNGYLHPDIQEWMKAHGKEREKDDLLSIKAVGRAGLIPSKELLEYLVDKPWQDEAPGKPLTIQEKVLRLQGYRKEFEDSKDPDVLVDLLFQNKDKAMAFYILESGRTRFDLINNYLFTKFYELLSLIHELKPNQVPLDQFRGTLKKAGFDVPQIDSIVTNLQNGRHPFYSADSPVLQREIRLDVSNNAKYEASRNEVADILGKNQIGIFFKIPYYRRYLEVKKDNLFLTRITGTLSPAELAGVITQIETKYPDFKRSLIADLKTRWTEVTGKMGLSLALEDVINNDSNPVNIEGFIDSIEQRRSSYQHSINETLLALTSENPEEVRIRAEIRRKQKVIHGEKGLKAASTHNPLLQGRIHEIEEEIAKLHARLAEISQQTVVNRYAQMDPEEKRALMEEQKENLRALTSKNTSSIFMWLMGEVAGKDVLNNNDIAFAKEIASHLEAPFNTVKELGMLESQESRSKQGKKVRVRMLDKKKDLMTMVRFADSKICCFSSSNYDVVIRHGVPNKEWVTSINKDPLSFVFEVEDVSNGEKEKQGLENSESLIKNIGFVFGTFGVSEEGYPVVMLNGVYISTGNDYSSVSNILQSIEEMLSRPIRAEEQIVGSQHGGKIFGDMKDYTSTSITVTRLRALDNGNGVPERKIYDDLGTVINTKTDMNGVLHKPIHIYRRPSSSPLPSRILNRLRRKQPA